MMQTVNALDIEAAAALQLTSLYRLKDVLETLQQNMDLLAAGDNGQRITIAGGNLYALAAQYYGDATYWTVIAEANKSQLRQDNGFIDPQLTGLVTLVIPPKPAQATGGIFDD